MKLRLDANQSERCPQADHTLLLECYTTHSPLQGRSHGLQGFSPLWPPLPAKAMKATLRILLHPKFLSPRLFFFNYYLFLAVLGLHC